MQTHASQRNSALTQILAQSVLYNPDAMIILDSNENIIFMNQATEQLWKIHARDYLDHPIQKLIEEDLSAAFDAQTSTQIWQRWITTTDNVTYPVELTFTNLAFDATLYLCIKARRIDERLHRLDEVYLLSLVADETDAAILVTDPQKNVIYANLGVERLFGYAAQTVVGQSISSLFIGKHTSSFALNQISEHIQAGIEHTEHVLLYDNNDKSIWIACVLRPVYNEKGRLRHVIATLRDITDNQLHHGLQQKIMQAIASNAPLVDVMGMICHAIEQLAPDALPALYKREHTEELIPVAISESLNDLLHHIGTIKVDPNHGSTGAAVWAGKLVVSYDITTDTRWDGYHELIEQKGLKTAWTMPIKARDGHILGAITMFHPDHCYPSTFHLRLLSTCTDLCALALENAEIEEHIHHLAFYDTLTGLPNRIYLQQQLGHLLHNLLAQGSQVALLFIDIDHFKHINDSLGHLAGDHVLAEIAKRLKDTVSAHDIISRLAGDEFVVVSPNADNIMAESLSKRIIQQLNIPLSVNGITLEPSVSVGISLCPQDGTTQADLIKHADMAMYQAKLNGRGRYAFYDAELNQQAQERLTIEYELRHALQNDLLTIYYQPQLSLATGQLTGLEALIRWHSDKLGDISPSRFIPLAEQTGMIETLQEWVIKHACIQMKTWQKNYIIPNVSINISPVHFANSRLIEQLDRILESTNISPTKLIFEITEGVMLDSLENTQAIIHEIAKRGIRFAIDDFGTGYANFSYFQHFPIAEIKLDKSFVKDIETNSNAKALVTAIIKMATKLDISVVAEGIETYAQHEILLAEGCHIGQGFYFSQPLPAHELEQWIDTTLPGLHKKHTD